MAMEATDMVAMEATEAMVATAMERGRCKTVFLLFRFTYWLASRFYRNSIKILFLSLRLGVSLLFFLFGSGPVLFCSFGMSSLRSCVS